MNTITGVFVKGAERSEGCVRAQPSTGDSIITVSEPSGKARQARMCPSAEFGLDYHILSLGDAVPVGGLG